MGRRHGLDPCIAVAMVQAGGDSSYSTPSQGTSIYLGFGPRKDKKKKKKEFSQILGYLIHERPKT